MATAFNETILLEKWHLAANGDITAWVPQVLHNSKPYAELKACYTGRTYGSQVYDISIDGLNAVNGISIDYEYCIPLTHIKQRKVKWQWQGLYDNKVVIEFNIEQHIQETNHKAVQMQTLKELIEIITKLNEPKYRLHNFRLSEGIVLCQHCGELLADLKKEKKTDVLPGCLACHV